MGEQPIASLQLPYCTTSNEQLVLVREPDASIGVLHAQTTPGFATHFSIIIGLNHYFFIKTLVQQHTAVVLKHKRSG